MFRRGTALSEKSNLQTLKIPETNMSLVLVEATRISKRKATGVFLPSVFLQNLITDGLLNNLY